MSEHTLERDYMHEDWFSLLRAKVANSSMSQVARELAYSPTAISLVMNGKYKGKPDKLRDQVLQRYDVVACPFSGSLIPIYQCMDTAHSPAPTHNPLKMAQWKTCQSCANRPQCSPKPTPSKARTRRAKSPSP